MTIRLKADFNRNRNNRVQKSVKLSLKCLKKITFNLDLKSSLKRPREKKDIFRQIKTKDLVAVVFSPLQLLNDFPSRRKRALKSKTELQEEKVSK